jgi:hypothetical protein
MVNKLKQRFARMGTSTTTNREKGAGLYMERQHTKGSQEHAQVIQKGRGTTSLVLVDKAKAFTTMWVVKLIQNKTNPILESTMQAAVNWYSKARGTEVPL